MKRVAIVTGGSSGLGAEIMTAIAPHYSTLINWSMAMVDLRFEDQVKGAARKAITEHGAIDTLINCAGVNHIEWLPKLEVADWDRVMNTNARGIFLTAKYLCDAMKGGTILNIVSNASHVPMTTSAAYNASKAAAAILTGQLSRELGKTHDITCFAISPNKLKGTGMSGYIDEQVCKLRGWTAEQARAYQLAALPAGEETNPRVLAEFIAYLLSSKERHKFLAGVDIPYGGP
jgi:NAD(P)-dependent dehydrogenase (short-subunit alcohol dehydrogenase family)